MTFQEVRTTQKDTSRQREPFQASQVIWLLLGLLEAAFALRFVLKLLGANPANPFAMLLYNATGVFLVPFIGITPAPALAGMVFEIYTVIAMLVYGVLGGVLQRAAWNIFYRPYAEVAVTPTIIPGPRRP